MRFSFSSLFNTPFCFCSSAAPVLFFFPLFEFATSLLSTLDVVYLLRRKKSSRVISKILEANDDEGESFGTN